MSLTKFSCISGLAAGTLLVVLFLTGGMFSGNHSLSVVPVAAAATQGLQLSLTVSEDRVALRNPVMLRGVVVDSGSGKPVSGAAVSFAISRPGGTTTITVNTDNNGVAEWKYKAQHEGVYSITATASSAGLTAISGPVTFAATEVEAPAPHVQPSVPTAAVA